MASADTAVMEEKTSEQKISEDVEKLELDPLIKHPLQNRWCLWFFKNDKSKDWADNLRQITSFDTVEDFWAVYNHIQSAGKLASGCDYNLFKDDIKPMWEDERNKTGGRWLASFDKRGGKGIDVDKLWLETVLCLIGEGFDEESDVVNGCVVNVRGKGNKLSVWIGDYKRDEVVLKIGRRFKERLGLPPRFQIAFEAHQDTIVKRGSSAKSRFTI
ncbi:eukaryotic translation initiation factor 4E [Apostichopus japonicus]|uniref:Eukaryotic translation initiation factor 4E n=1 Tax=Stichopus japonicus TaxID=307972 RepID=A0A2G8KS18_STIJA|nr:eukaryotic translation initiation factor 4E [Apostichopus japonicus]